MFRRNSETGNAWRIVGLRYRNKVNQSKRVQVLCAVNWKCFVCENFGFTECLPEFVCILARLVSPNFREKQINNWVTRLSRAHIHVYYDSKN